MSAIPINPKINKITCQNNENANRIFKLNGPYFKLYHLINDGN